MPNTDIGIDLGTTYSVVAVKGRVEFAPGYPPGDYREEYDVTIIPNLDGDHTTPSAVWIDPSLLDNDPTKPALTIDPVEIWKDPDPDRRALFLVGMPAKQKAADGETPIVFSKRSIGTDEPLKMHHRTFTAKEVAVFILKYLKFCAETALGQPVRRAVVTHPAHFLPNQVQETKEAAVLAGFDMSLGDQMMMEPAAAALSYVHSDPRDPLRILTYDLGGGTFDVTVMERCDGVITIKSFDGNHLLGGYNFDRELVQWIVEKAQAGGRKIVYDETNPDHRSRRGQLLQLAETTKFRLSTQLTSKAPVPIAVRDLLTDEAGKIVPVSDRINREQYAALIGPHLASTIKCCHSALSKAGMTKDDLHLVLLVGGSTCGPWVEEAVKAEFGDDVPPPVDPDKCVAAGAAIQANQLPKVDALGDDLELEHDAPATSGLPSLNLGGKVRAKGGGPVAEAERSKLQALLCTPAAGTLGPLPIQPNGSFLFPDVELLEGRPSQFELQIAGGPIVHKVAFSVLYDPISTGYQPILPSLPKPLYVKSARGLLLLAEEGVALPAECEMDLKKLFSDSMIKIPIVLADEKIGEIVINQIPPDADEGSPIKLKVTITQKNEMVGTAQIFSRTGAMVKECPVRITFPPLVVPGLPELRQHFHELKDERDQLLFTSEDPEQRLLLAGEGERVVMVLERLFGELEPDKPAASPIP
jgi:molecular chaperone DnaK (HSP70)